METSAFLPPPTDYMEKHTKPIEMISSVSDITCQFKTSQQSNKTTLYESWISIALKQIGNHIWECVSLSVEREPVFRGIRNSGIAE